MARYGMLECGKNFKGTLSEVCDKCGILDDENHRLNFFPKYKPNNNFDCSENTDFNLIYSESITKLRQVIPNIMKVWNIKNGNGTMHCN